MLPIAIIGAGLAGLTAARLLAEAGRAVRLFDKGRGVGGRLATRRVTHAGATHGFDHGAQYVRAEGPAFAALLDEAGARPWPDPLRRVATPGMSAVLLSTQLWPMAVLGSEPVCLRLTVKVLQLLLTEMAWVLKVI